MRTRTLSIKKLRKDAFDIFRSALKPADPLEAVQREVMLKGNHLTIGDRHYHLKDFQNIFVVGAGKCSARMAQAIEKIIGF